eukprot:TRINITY_DN4082_c0_g2_i3.p1 TRINITY_DN4082_c0_g2~~TRINITY_DN4082_c0_g2_i3.p1  ORF type:complete len:168 (+),score=49.57 TRINITY_DN4082_c0_g2_i3:40-504(+)
MPKVLRPITAAAAGIIFTFGWLLFVDANIYQCQAAHPRPAVEWYMYVPLAVATVALMAANIFEADILDPNNWWGDEGMTTRARAWMLGCFFLGFSAVGAAVWIAAVKFWKAEDLNSQFAPVALVLSPIIIFISSLVFLLGRVFKSEDDEYAGLF